MKGLRTFSAAPLAVLLLVISAIFTSHVSASINSHYITSNALEPCMENSGFSASYFDISLHPNTSKLYFDIDGYSTVQGKVKLYLTVFAYGFRATQMVFDPCTNGWTQLCPMNPGKIELNSNEAVGDDMIAKIPSAVYQVPDIDGRVRIEVYSANGSPSRLACVEARISNGQTVEQSAVSWAIAIVTGAFVLAAITAIAMSSPYNPNYPPATAKFAVYSFVLFVFFQTQALFGMTSVSLPPIVAAWVQNFMWAVGIVQASGLQHFFHWYIQSTGGEVAELLSNSQTSVLIAKRDVIPSNTPPLGERDFSGMWEMAATQLEKRAEALGNYQQATVKGIERVAYKVGIERTNVFITAYGVLLIVILSVLVAFMIFKFAVDLMVKKKIAGMENKLISFRANWQAILRTIMLSIIVMAYPGITALCLWELTMRDSPGTMALAVIMFLATTSLMGYFIWKVIMILKENSIMPFGQGRVFGKVRQDKEKGSMADPTAEVRISNAKKNLKRFGLMTILYDTGCMIWVLPVFLCNVIISALVGLAQQHVYQPPKTDISTFGQGKGGIQAVGILVVEFLLFISFCWVKPWGDKRTNLVGIVVGLVVLLDSVFLLIFSNIFHRQPAYLSSVLGVVYFVINSLTSLTLLILAIVGAIYAIIDWRAGEGEGFSVATPPESTGANSNLSTFRPSNFGTPDPFVPKAHTSHSVPSSSMTAVESRAQSGLVVSNGLSEEEIANRHGSMAESLDSATQIHDLQPTEPNMSTGNLGRGAGGVVTSVILPPAPVGPRGDFQDHGPLQSPQTYQMHPLSQVQSHGSNIVAGSGVVGIGPRPGSASAYAESQRSGRSGHAQPPYNLPHYPPQFQRQESHVSLRSVRSNQSHRSNFSRPPAPSSPGGYVAYGSASTQDIAPPRHSMSTRSTTSREYFREPRGNNSFGPAPEHQHVQQQYHGGPSGTGQAL